MSNPHPQQDDNAAKNRPVLDIDAHPDNANWLRILEDQRIKREQPPTKEAPKHG